MAINQITANPAAMDRDGICAAQHMTSGTALTINGVIGATQEIARIIGIYSSADLSSSKNFVIVGTDARGSAISETVAGPNNGTVVSTLLYKTIASVTPDFTDGANNVEVGTVATTLSAESTAHTLSHSSGVAATVAVNISGTINFSVLETFDNPFQDNMISTACTWYAVTALASKTADTRAQITPHATAVKVQINSYSTGATCVMTVVTGNRISE